MKFNKKKFAKEVWKARNPHIRQGAAKLSMREAAKQSGVSFSTISRVVRGQIPDIKKFLKLCTWMDVSPMEYFK